MNPALDVAARWLCTFAVHSALFTALALAFASLVRQRALAWQEAALRLALLGGLATSVLQLAVCGGPLVSWGAAAAMFAAPPTVEPIGAPAAAAPEVPLPADAAPALPTDLLLLAVAAAGAACGCAWLLAARARLRALLSDRRAETDARVLAAAVAAADALGLGQLPLLSRAAALGSPVTFGLLRAEVCLPARVDELGAAELRALFCHEFAHISRGDAGWLWLGAWLQALFPWQLWLWPLRRRLCAVAELRCDAAASRCTNPVAVAQCLVQVASWLGTRRAPAGTLAMAARPSALRTRVEAALADRTEARVPAPAGSLLAAGALVLFAAAAPGVRRDDAAVPARGEDARAGAAVDGDPLRALHEECALLAAEAQRLQRETAGNGDPELRQMLDRLRIRVAAMTRLGGRLMALDERMNHGSNGSRRSR